jgi:Flp pilus assembly protein TadD
MSLASYLRKRAEIRQKLALHEALRALEIGVESTAPNTPPALLEHHGIALAEVGRTGAAIEVFERLLELDPDNAVAREWLARLSMAPPSGESSKEP